jgi:hypothetical protein
MDLQSREFKKKYPNLAKEITANRSVTLSELMESSNLSKNPKDDHSENNPKQEDYLRRCETVEEAKMTIDYLKQKGDISVSKADRLNEKLKKEGLRLFRHKRDVDTLRHRD